MILASNKFFHDFLQVLIQIIINDSARMKLNGY